MTCRIILSPCADVKLFWTQTTAVVSTPERVTELDGFFSHAAITRQLLLNAAKAADEVCTSQRCLLGRAFGI